MDQYTSTLQRQKEIEDTLLTLMDTTPFARITVADLAKHAGISRKCFYHYFPNKEACLVSLTDRNIRDAALYVSHGLRHRKSNIHGYVLNLEYWKAQPRFLKAIQENHLERHFFQRCMVHNLTEEKQIHKLMHTTNLPFDEDILYFCISGQLSLLMNWYSRGFDTPVEEMANKYYRLLRLPLINDAN